MLITAIAGFCLAYYFVNVLQAPMRIKRAFKLPPAKRIKPFDCVQCLSVWLTVIIYFLPVQYQQFIAAIFLAGFISTKVQ